MSESSAERLDGFLVGLLAFIDVGQPNSVAETFDAKAGIEKVLSENGLRGRAEINLTKEFRALTCVKTEFTTLVDCLISNAARHCPDYPVNLTIKGNVTKQSVTLDFIDNGPGIDAKFQARIFEPFETLKPRDQVEGSGLGLAIATKIMRNWSGGITLVSSLGAGSNFQISFPVI